MMIVPDFVQITLTLIISYANRWTADKSDYALVDTPTHKLPSPVYDVWYSNFGAPLAKHHYLADLFICSLLILAVPLSSWEQAMHFNRVYGFLFLIRGLCIFSTTGYVSYRKKTDQHTQSHGANKNYTDLVISGHTMTAMLLLYNIYDGLFIIDEYAVEDTKYLLFSIFISIMSVLTNLLVGDHYTADIIIGITLSYFVHYSSSF